VNVMSRTVLNFMTLAALLALPVVAPLHAADKAQAVKAPAGSSLAEPTQESIPYDELKSHVGERIVVHTRYKTTRTGVLTKFSQIELTLTMPTPSGPAEMTLPKETVLRVTPAETPDPLKH